MIECIEKSDGLAVTLDHLKSHLRLESSHEDLYLEQLIRAATEYCEKHTQRTFLYKLYKRLYLPRDKKEKIHLIDLYYPPLVTIVSVAKLFPGNKREIIQRYMLSPSTHRPRLTVWGHVVEVIYKTGYGDKPNDIPEGVRQAIVMVAADMYEKRTEMNSLASSAVVALLQPYKVGQCL